MLVEIWVDGAFIPALPGFGLGGWGVVMSECNRTTEMSGVLVAAKSSQQMETYAAVMALEPIVQPRDVVIRSDSRCLIDTMQSSRIAYWREKGWRTGSRGNRWVQDRALWERLELAAARHRVAWEWVRGHAGEPGNRRSHQLAIRAVRKLQGK